MLCVWTAATADTHIPETLYSTALTQCLHEGDGVVSFILHPQTNSTMAYGHCMSEVVKERVRRSLSAHTTTNLPLLFHVTFSGKLPVFSHAGLLERNTQRRLCLSCCSNKQNNHASWVNGPKLNEDHRKEAACEGSIPFWLSHISHCCWQKKMDYEDNK